MLTFIKSCDFCSTGPNLRVNNQNNVKSLYGGIVSIILSILVSLLVVYKGRLFALKLDPNVIKSEKSLDEPIIWQLNSSNFVVGVKLVDDNVLNIENPERVVNIQFKSILGKSSNDTVGETPWTWEIVQYPLVNCSYYSNYISELKPWQYSTFSCPKDFNMAFGGSQSNSEYGSIEIEVSLCRNDSALSQQKCASLSEIEYLLKKGLYFTILYRDYLVDARNSTNPVTFEQLPLIIPLSTSLSKEIRLFYKNQSVLSDTGFILDDIKNELSLKFSGKETEYSQNNDYSLPLTKVHVSVLNKSLIYSRKYTKFYELAVSIGGMTKFLMIISNFLIYFINLKNINLALINELYQFFDEPTSQLNMSTKLDLKIQHSTCNDGEKFKLKSISGSSLQKKDIIPFMNWQHSSFSKNVLSNVNNEKIICNFESKLSFINIQEMKYKVNLGLGINRVKFNFLPQKRALSVIL